MIIKFGDKVFEVLSCRFVVHILLLLYVTLTRYRHSPKSQKHVFIPTKHQKQLSALIGEQSRFFLVVKNHKSIINNHQEDKANFQLGGGQRWRPAGFWDPLGPSSLTPSAGLGLWLLPQDSVPTCSCRHHPDSTEGNFPSMPCGAAERFMTLHHYDNRGSTARGSGTSWQINSWLAVKLVRRVVSAHKHAKALVLNTKRFFRDLLCSVDQSKHWQHLQSAEQEFHICSSVHKRNVKWSGVTTRSKA